jgi:hypothetical protein
MRDENPQLITRIQAERAEGGMETSSCSFVPRVKEERSKEDTVDCTLSPQHRSLIPLQTVAKNNHKGHNPYTTLSISPLLDLLEGTHSCEPWRESRTLRF